MKIHQTKFIELLAADMGITYSQAEHFVTMFKNFMYEQLAAGNSVEFAGFGHFSVSQRRARTGVNPRSLEKITIPAIGVAKFKAGERLTDAARSAVTPQ